MNKTTTTKINDHTYIIDFEGQKFKIFIAPASNSIFISNWSKQMVYDVDRNRKYSGMFQLDKIKIGIFDNIIGFLEIDPRLQPIITRLVKLDLSAFA